ncbi:MAG TPA: response regulator transcription factor [Flavisolibacter sp.]|nr:response regulator transcription factor [Flavisolibacter sp.]
MKILLLEDDFKLATEVQLFLTRQGYQCELVYDGLIFFKQSIRDDYDLYLLDINVPSLNGLDVCKKIRESDPQTPILMLTAYSVVEDKVQALTVGADDYLVKPFHLDELAARIKALARRSAQPHNTPDKIYEIGDLLINTTEMKVSRAGKEIVLTPKEYKLLELLARQGGRTVSKQTISEQVWDIHFETGTNTIEVYISFLRNKIDKGFDSPLIHTRAGYGYFLKETR